MNEIIIMIFSGLGTLLILIAAIGMVRMPDFYLRLSVTTKAATLGIAFILISAAVYFNVVSITTRVLAIIFFLLVTAPVAAHMIGRTSYFIGIRMWGKSQVDELHGMYTKDTHELRSGEEGDPADSKPTPGKDLPAGV